MKGTYTKVTYPLVFPFKLSYGTFHKRSGVIVRLTQGGYSGYGEMSFVPYYGKDEREVLIQLRQILTWMEKRTESWTPKTLYTQICNIFSPDPFLMSAVDCALYDLYGKIQGIPVWQLIGGQREVHVNSSLTITQDDWKEKLNWGWPVLKLKMGFDGDMDLLQEVRKSYQGDLRIDANSGWSIEGFQERMAKLEALNVSLIEQPVDPNFEHMLKDLDLTIPLAADESIQGTSDVDKITKIYQVANLKLQKCGGITPALEIIRKCREKGLKLMAGCMTESSVGIGAMAHLGSYFDYLDLDGEHLIKVSFRNSTFVRNGQIELLDQAGLGGEFSLS